MKKALITGINGQIGSYLAEILLSKDYEVYGISENSNSSMAQFLTGRGCKIYEFNIQEPNRIEILIDEITPHEIYNLAAITTLHSAEKYPEETFMINTLALMRICAHVQKYNPSIKIFQASSAEIYGKNTSEVIDENTVQDPQSIYAITKSTSDNIIKYYRTHYNLFCCSGVIFNSASERSSDKFVTKKIVRSVNNFLIKREPLTIGNLNSYKDWTHARDTAQGIYLMLQSGSPKDHIIASGSCHTVREFIEVAFKKKGIEIVWKGEGIDEKGFDRTTNSLCVMVDTKYFRLNEINKRVSGDSFKLKNELGWEPEYDFKRLVETMIENDS